MKLEVLVRQYSIIIIRGSPMWTVSLLGNSKTDGLSSPPLVTNVAGNIHSGFVPLRGWMFDNLHIGYTVSIHLSDFNPA